MYFCTSDFSTISLHSCLWGAHQCLRHRETDNATARAQQLGKLIKCMSTADLQLPPRRESQTRAPGSESWGLQGLEFLHTGAGIGKDGRLGPGCGLIATADIVASRDNPHQARTYCNPRNSIATVIEELCVLGIVLRGFHIRSYTGRWYYPAVRGYLSADPRPVVAVTLSEFNTSKLQISHL